MLRSTQDLPCILNRFSTTREWRSDRRGKAVFEPIFRQMTAQMAAILGGGEGDQAIGMDMTGFMMEMPPLSLLRFQERHLPVSAEEIIGHLEDARQILGAHSPPGLQE